MSNSQNVAYYKIWPDPYIILNIITKFVKMSYIIYFYCDYDTVVWPDAFWGKIVK